MKFRLKKQKKGSLYLSIRLTAPTRAWQAEERLWWSTVNFHVHGNCNLDVFEPFVSVGNYELSRKMEPFIQILEMTPKKLSSLKMGTAQKTLPDLSFLCNIIKILHVPPKSCANSLIKAEPQTFQRISFGLINHSFRPRANHSGFSTSTLLWLSGGSIPRVPF